jgi:hypothetical protein
MRAEETHPPNGIKTQPECYNYTWCVYTSIYNTYLCVYIYTYIYIHIYICIHIYIYTYIIHIYVYIYIITVHNGMFWKWKPPFLGRLFFGDKNSDGSSG